MPGMGVNLWGASPLYENRKVFMIKNTIKSTSRRQWREGDRPSEGSRSAKVRDDEQKPHTRLSLRASQPHMTKPTGSGDKVNAAFVHGKFTFLSGEICLPCVETVMSKAGTGSSGIERTWHILSPQTGMSPATNGRHERGGNSRRVRSA